jgi:hypothetical protein
MHEARKSSPDLIILFMHDYEQSPYARKEFTRFEAESAQSVEERNIIVLRREDLRAMRLGSEPPGGQLQSRSRSEAASTLRGRSRPWNEEGRHAKRAALS